MNPTGANPRATGILCRPGSADPATVPDQPPPTPRPPALQEMASFEAELDSASNIVQVVVTEDDGSEHDYQFDFDPRTGRWEFSERDLLERDFGEEWVEELETEIERLIEEGVDANSDDDDDEEGDDE